MKDCTFVGGSYLQNTVGASALRAPPAGLFAPNMEFFLVDGVEFYNYGNNAAITQCFDCCGYRARQGAYTTRFNRLRFSGSSRRVGFACPGKPIFFDLDGSLSGGDPGSSVINYNAFNDWEECDRANSTWTNGLICNSSVRVRKVGIPLTAGVPKVYAPLNNGGRDIYVKKSRMIKPHGFTAVFETPRNGSKFGVVPGYERSHMLAAISSFLALDQVHVVDGEYPAGYTVENTAAGKESIGVAVLIGGHLGESIHTNDEAGRTTVEVSYDGLCNTGLIETVHEVWDECAQDDGVCNCMTEARYGKREAWNYKTIPLGQTSVQCTRQSFSSGPLPTGTLYCYCRCTFPTAFLPSISSFTIPPLALTESRAFVVGASAVRDVFI